MKNIEVNELKEFLTCDYIFLPYTNKEELNINEDGTLYKCDEISKGVISPVSGLVIGTTKMYDLTGTSDVLVIENDFKDKVKHRKPAVKDIYSLSDNEIKKNIRISKNVFAVKIEKRSKTDMRDAFLLKDYTRELLETLNLIDNAYKEIKVKIILDRNDFTSYQTLFNYIGTYPNIEIEFSSNKIRDYEEVSVLKLLDIYYKIKNSVNRDFIYLTVETQKKVDVVKVKKYSNLKEVLQFLEILPKKIIVNSEKNLTNDNLLLDDRIYLITVM